MSDLYDVCPDSGLLKTNEFDDLFLAFDKYSVPTSELALHPAKWLAERCHYDICVVQKFQRLYLHELRKNLQASVPKHLHNLESKFTTGDKALDRLLGGGISTKSITEIAGESAVGKSNILTQLSLSVQLPVGLGGLDRNTIYISTEHGFETRRMNDLLYGFLRRFPGSGSGSGSDPDSASSLSGDRIFCITTKNQDEFENLVVYRLSMAIKQYNVGLVVIDSIAAHYRSEYDMTTQYSDRSKSLLRIRRWLRRLAEDHNVAIVCSNQVSERFIKEIDSSDQQAFERDRKQRKLSGWNQPSVIVKERDNYKSIKIEAEVPSSPPITSSQFQRSSPQGSVGSSPLIDLEDLAKLESPKTPFLGFAWTHCLDQRIVLKRYDTPGGTRRTIEVVFSSFCAAGRLEFQIMQDGVSMIVYE